MDNKMLKSKYVLFGAGIMSLGAVNYFNKQQIVAVIDNSPFKIGTEFEGLPVISFGEYLDKYRGIDVIITIQRKYYYDIKQQLEESGIYNYFTAPPVVYGYRLPEDIAYDLAQKKPYRLVFYDVNPISLRMYEWIKDNSSIECNFIKMKRKSGKIVNDVRLSYIEFEDLLQTDTLILTTNEAEENIREEIKKYTVADVYDIYEDDLPTHPELAIYKDKYKGQRCFVIGNGPSLKAGDLDKLKEYNEKSMGCNGIYKIYQKTSWRPTYYMMQDILGYELFGKDLQEIANHNFFLIKHYYTDLMNIKDANCFTMYNKIYEENEMYIFSDDITKFVGSGRTVTYGMIQLACYMGFKEIYLLGVDCTGGKGPNFQREHFADINEKEENNMFFENCSEEIRAYESAKQYADTHGIKIYNATRGGELEVFERVDFDSLFEDK